MNDFNIALPSGNQVFVIKIQKATNRFRSVAF